MQFIAPDIYAITDSQLSLNRPTVEVVSSLVSAGIKVIQYREKNISKRQMFAECIAIRQITAKNGCLFIVNDHVDLALACKADGVHVGQDDLPLQAVRKLVGPELIVGVSARTMHEAQQGILDGADYLGVGAVFATGTKDDALITGLSLLKSIPAASPVPVVAIGGITLETLPQVLACGVRSCAMVSALTMAPDIPARVAAIRNIFTQ